MTEDRRTPDLDPVTPEPARPADRIEQLADDALEAGRKLMETDTGRKVADAADTAFNKAEELGRRAFESDAARDAGETAKKIWQTPVGRNMGIGAAAGAAVGLVIPGIGSVVGAVLGGGLGYLRTITKKR